MKKNEIERLHDWSVKYDGNYRFTGVDKNTKSYFATHEEKEYIREYGFETIVEVKTELEKMWSGNRRMEEIIKTVAVATMKNEPKEAENKEKIISLNECIYIF